MNLGVAIGHVLHQATGGQSPAVRRSKAAVDGDVHDGPNAVSVLLTEPEEAHLADRYQWRQDLQLRSHLNYEILIRI